jgi:hypothetical protein
MEAYARTLRIGALPKLKLAGVWDRCAVATLLAASDTGGVFFCNRMDAGLMASTFVNVRPCFKRIRCWARQVPRET